MRPTSLKRDLQKRPTKETYERDLQQRPTKKTPKKDKQKRPTKETCKRDLMTPYPQRSTNMSHKKHIKLKRDLYHSKETYKKDKQKRPNDSISTAQHKYVPKEAHQTQKRPVSLKRDLQKRPTKET